MPLSVSGGFLNFQVEPVTVEQNFGGWVRVCLRARVVERAGIARATESSDRRYCSLKSIRAPTRTHNQEAAAHAKRETYSV